MKYRKPGDPPPVDPIVKEKVSVLDPLEDMALTIQRERIAAGDYEGAYFAMQAWTVLVFELTEKGERELARLREARRKRGLYD